MAIGFSELLLVGLLGFACVGAIVAGVVVALSSSRRQGDSPREVMHCHECRAAVSPLDHFCPSCGHALRPQEIEKLDPDAR
jgi:rRNA maturation endonuclease Nob1